MYGYTIITVSSITYALKGKEILERQGIFASVTRNPNYMGTSGCGYGLKIKGDGNKAVMILKSKGIRILSVGGEG